MKKYIQTVYILLLLAKAQAQPQSYWQQQVDYTIDVSLNDPEKSLDGFIRIRYINNSPDTLPFIWFHCWPNAYKNDRTAFSEQLLGNGRTDFYFSDKEKRGYINRLDFRADGQEAKMEDHPLFIDIIKVILPKPLLPGGQTTLTTPFHVKLPYNFSRGGWTLSGKLPRHRPFFVEPVAHRPPPPTVAYQITQWYPKPAVYDHDGWHPMPYLDQGEFFSEFGSFDVRITVPNALKIAATGEIQDTTHPNADTKTLHYKQDRIHDFAWFADRHFNVEHDTLQLPSGRIIDVYSYYNPNTAPDGWKGSTAFIKDAVRFRSALIGEYPYNTVTAVQTKMGSTGGMEYPTITAINSPGPSRDIDLTIEHEVGHNWFYGILATNEREYPWMDEGINTYYDNRYEAEKYPPDEDLNLPSYYTAAVQKRDQPIATPAPDFTEENYFNIAYTKTGFWLKRVEDSLGTPLFDSCMRQFYRTWQFKHPCPADFKAALTSTSHHPLDTLFALLDKKGAIPHLPHRQLKPTLLFSLKQTGKYNYLGLAPAFGYNDYDHFMAGVLIHNFNLPPNPIQFYLAPLYATGSKQLNGSGELIASLYPDHRLQKIQALLGAQRFSSMRGIDSNGTRITGGYYKVTPGLRIVFQKPNARSTLERSIEWKTFLIGEKDFGDFVRKSTDSLYYPTRGKYSFRYLNQLSFDIRDTRVLYPYNVRLQFQQAANWYRANFIANYFFNYEKGGGFDVRLFGAKFGYLGTRSPSEDLSRFEPKLTALRGNEDYTYSGYFIGRNEFTGGASQQILLRDGDLPIRTDLFQGLQGRSDNWVASINLRTTLPRALCPEWIPLHLFFDAGTYAEAWGNNPPTSHFLYVGGLELSVIHDVVRIFLPIAYSGDISSQLKTVPDQNSFTKRISFSISLQNIDLKKLLGSTPF